MMTLTERILARATPGPGGCLLWTGATTDKGYGQIRDAGAVRYVHRAIWEEAHGPIPAGLTIDHLCRNKLCVALAHLEVVTRAENGRRANPLKARCVHGHSLADAYHYGNRRDCRTCRKRTSADFNRRRREEARAGPLPRVRYG